MLCSRDQSRARKPRPLQKEQRGNGKRPSRVKISALVPRHGKKVAAATVPISARTKPLGWQVQEFLETVPLGSMPGPQSAMRQSKAA
jgi:hypothetical protein